jgi:hypothetical protein
MELAKLILEFLKVLTWPVTTVVIAFFFRKPLVAILTRIRKAGLPGGVSLDFQEEIKEAEQLSKDVPPLAPPADKKEFPTIPLTEANTRMIQLGLQPVSSGLDVSYFRELARQDTTLALAGLRIEIEILVRNLSRGFKIEQIRNEPISSMLSRLHAHAAVTAPQVDLARKVLAICNRAIHGQPVSRLEADQVIDAVSILYNNFLAWLGWGFDDNWVPKETRILPLV